jgi:LmbE family N-acetylglucosaminyl deacetylase
VILEDLTTARDYQHVVLAPHPDDAALSCGGTIARLCDEQARVLVVTICAGSPEPGRLSPFARYLHEAWALGEDPIAGRRAEDARAMALLGCDGVQLEQLDAPYRHAAYGEGDAWRGTVAAGDPLAPAASEIITHLYAQQPDARFYAPLGAGNHVDHQVIGACAASASLAELWWYEDLPYAAKQPGAVESRLAALGDVVQPRIVDISSTMGRKLDAVACFASQQRELFGDADGARMLRDYAAAIAGHTGFAERFWAPGAILR